MKKLYKSDTDKRIDGVCGGIGEYFDLDPNVIRLAWVIFSCIGGAGIVAYLLAMLIIPRKNPVIDV